MRKKTNKTLVLLCGLIFAVPELLCTPATAADILLEERPIELPAVTPDGWTFNAVPYGWVTSMKGDITVKGRSVNVDASFVDIVKKSDTLIALFGTFTARNGRFSVYSDIAWAKIGLTGSTVKSRALAPGIGGELGVSLGLDYQMAIVEAGAAYEVMRTGQIAFDLIGGVRYWRQQVDLAFALGANFDIGDLVVSGNRTAARSGSVDWLDPLIGARARYAAAPGHELFLRGDIGGFGIGSNFSWQAIGGYSFDFSAWGDVKFAGIVGYRALAVDYAQGTGRSRFEFDMLVHGPIIGLSGRW